MSKSQGIIKLHGRNYKTVALRVQEFRQTHSIEDGWGLCTRLISVDDQRVVFRASVVDPTGKEIAVGFAEEMRTPRGINAASALALAAADACTFSSSCARSSACLASTCAAASRPAATSASSVLKR